MAVSLSPVTIAGEALTDTFHTCALFDNDADEAAVLEPFIREAIEAGDRMIIVVDPAQLDERRRRLVDAGFDVDALSASHQLELVTWNDTYLRSGQFDQDAMLALVRETFAQSRELGFPRTRVIGNMEWRLTELPGVDRMIEYEAKCNHMLAELQQPAICVYRIDHFDARTLLDVLRTHPLVVMGRTVRENPFFVDPDVFLHQRVGVAGLA